MTAVSHPMRWWQVVWPRPLTEDLAVRVVKGWAADQRSPLVVLEARGHDDFPLLRQGLHDHLVAGVAQGDGRVHDGVQVSPGG